MPAKKTQDPWHLRKCKNCKLTYKPTGKDRGNAERSIFCTRKCKDRYHRSGGMNIEQLRELLIRATIKALKADDAFLEAIADKLRVVSTVPPVLPAVSFNALRSGGTSPNTMTFAPGDH
jgi:hypothetical protein